MARVGFLTSSRFLDHDPGRGHPERPQRLEAIWERLDREGLLREMDLLEPRPADRAWLRAVHTLAHLDLLSRAQAEAARERRVLQLDPDTACGPASYDTAVLAAGGVMEAAAAVLEGRVDRAFCAVRPPGHHAEPGRAMGFCLLNNVALAARRLVEQGGAGRVLVLDWDVHHGNGTQAVFEADPAVYYASLHQEGIFPGTGFRHERGTGEAEGTVLNVPLEAGAGDEEMLRALDEVVAPEVERFRPEFVLVSAGFDAHRDDPLAGLQATRRGFEEMTRRVLDWAREHAGGRLVSVLEGGYDLDALATCVEGHLQTMLESV